MSNFEIVPIPLKIANEIRQSMADRYGHLLKYTSPKERMNPCRLCLTDTDPGQRHILFSYMPFQENKSPYAEVGPIYLHEQCMQYANVQVFPVDIKKRKFLQLRGYDTGDQMICADLIAGHEIESLITTFFNNQSVSYLHVRHGQTGCYILKVLRHCIDHNPSDQ